MNLPAKALFRHFGTLRTWIVGIQYYPDASRATPDTPLVFARDPENPFDANAIAVYSGDGSQIGHLPHYDAAHFAPLIDEGVIALTGRITGPENNKRLPVLLDVHATEKVSSILARDERDDWRAAIHNLFIDVWSRIDSYSSETLESLREHVRDAAHKNEWYPKTQFLYRMLKAVAEARVLQERERYRTIAVGAMRALRVGAPMGWPELAIYPLDVPEVAPSPHPSSDSLAVLKPYADADSQLAVMKAIFAKCRYPTGARGFIAAIKNRFWELRWFRDPECAEVMWYSAVRDAVYAAMYEVDALPIDPERGPLATVETVLFDCKVRREPGDNSDELTVGFSSETYIGQMLIRRGEAVHLEFRNVQKSMHLKEKAPEKCFQYN